MNPMITFLKKQKPEWEAYLNLMEQMNQTDDNEVVLDIPDADEVNDDANITSSTLGIRLRKKLLRYKEERVRMLRTIKKLRSELSSEQVFTSSLAKAVGACPVCFGDDMHCEKCDGKGSPGAYVPDFILYNKLISPANISFSKHYNIKD